MSKQAYNLVTNVALLLGILSAFLYSHIHHEVAIGLAMIAGVMAVGAYFYNAFASCTAVHDEASCDRNDHGSSPAEVVVHDTASNTRVAIDVAVAAQHNRPMPDLDAIALVGKWARHDLISAYLEQMLSFDAKRKDAFMHHYLLHSNAGRRLRYQFEADNRLITPEVELSPKETASCAAEIIRELTSDGKEWSFAFDSKGLRVSQKKASAANIFAVFIEGEHENADHNHFYQNNADHNPWENAR
jgi:hypothetical protein